MTICNGNLLKEILLASYKWLNYKKDIVNNLNVFPVADGDTGYNMIFTLKEGIESIKDEDNLPISIISRKMADATLMASRGCSGVILSQIFEGFAKELDTKDKINANELFMAFSNSVEFAKNSIKNPVEGTILTVGKVGFEEALNMALNGQDDIIKIFKKAYDTANETLKKTPDMLPVLKDAGVVDSGGQGLVFMLEGALKYLKGEKLEYKRNKIIKISDLLYFYHKILGRKKRSIGKIEKNIAKETSEWNGLLSIARVLNLNGIGKITEGVLKIWENTLNMIGIQANAELKSIDKKARTIADTWEKDIKNRYCLEFIIKGKKLNAAYIEKALCEWGDEVFVINSDKIIKVHIHTNKPKRILKYAKSLGNILKTKIDDMEKQNKNLTGKDKTEYLKDIGIIEISCGKGFEKILKSLGCDIVISYKKIKPSTKDIVRAIKSVKAKNVIILPNEKDIYPSALQSASLSKCNVEVVLTKNIIQGISALYSYNPEMSLDDNKELIKKSISEVKIGKVTRAIRNISNSKVNIKKGDIIGIYEDKVTITGKNHEDVCYNLIDEIMNDEIIGITLFYGSLVPKRKVIPLINRLKKQYPDNTIEKYYGGQKYYRYLISFEK